LQNVGAIDAKTKRYQASVAFEASDDSVIEKQRELRAEQEARDRIRQFQKQGGSLRGLTVTPGSQIWFTHEPMVRFDGTKFSQFKEGKIMILFAGLSYYTDRNGSHRTYYCVRNNGNPAVIFSCGITQEE
jgi:hypothetical protein